MKSNRRKFLRNLGIGAGAITALPALAHVKNDEADIINSIGSYENEKQTWRLHSSRHHDRAALFVRDCRHLFGNQST